MADNFCSKCGNPLEPSDRFCRKCGTALGGQTAPPRKKPRFTLLNGCAVAAGGFLLLSVLLFVMYTITSRGGSLPAALGLEASVTASPTSTFTPWPTYTPRPSPTITPTSTLAPRPLSGAFPTSTPLPSDDPNSAYLSPAGFDGYCEMTISNQYPNADAVVILESQQTYETAVAVYVRANETFKVGGLKKGTYETYVTFGTDWDPGSGRFRNAVGYLRFQDPVVFETCEASFLASGFNYIKITLAVTEGETSPVNAVPPESFPRP
jgi:hypothetical protein